VDCIDVAGSRYLYLHHFSSNFGGKSAGKGKVVGMMVLSFLPMLRSGGGWACRPGGVSDLTM
jgi:hypothetical protein